jgi:cell division protease FtsH
MNPENKEPAPEQGKPKRNSSMIMVLIAGLLIALVFYGGDTPTDKMSMDQLWVDLYTGQVDTFSTNDTHSAFGIVLKDGTKRNVTVPDTRSVWERVARIHAKSRRMDASIPYGQFLSRMDLAEDAQSNPNRILPLKGYPLHVMVRSDPKDPKSTVLHRQRFFVEYADTKGTHYAEVDAASPDDSAIDLLALVQVFKDQEIEIATDLTFDTATGLTTESTSTLKTLLYSFGPILMILVLFWFLFMRQMKGQGQGMLGFGKSRATVYNKENRTGVTFEDVAGIEEAKDEVSEITEFLRNPDKFTRLGGRIPRGVMLVGPPGTGKTLLAKAIAGEADVPFISISGSDFVEMFVGVGASRVRDLFEGARKEAPCIIFLDEIDAVGRKRGSGMGGGNDEREQTLNAILVEMDGFSSDERVIVIAATNRPDVLDSALLRPGRFDREIVIDLPDVKGREKILLVHTKAIKLDPSVDISLIARGTPGFSGAELAALTNEAAILAAMRGHTWVTQGDLEESRDKVRFGRQKKSHVMEEEDKTITAYHEAGHAVVNAFMEHTDPVHKITIIPRGMALGATMFLPEKDRMHWSKNRLLDEICTLYGGRIAEHLFCDDITTGASSDIERASSLARQMITHWGMSEKLGAIHYGERQGNDFLGAEYGMGKDHSAATAQLIDEEVASLLDVQYKRAEKTLEANRDLMERVTEALMRFENVTKAEFELLVAGSTVDAMHAASPPAGNDERKEPPPVPVVAAEEPAPASEPAEGPESQPEE